MSDSSATISALGRVATFKSSLGTARHYLACVLVKLDRDAKLLTNPESCISKQATAAKPRIQL